MVVDRLTKTNEKGLKIIKDSESLQLKAYKDSGGVWTVGWGHTKSVYPGMHITEAAAEALLKKDLEEAETAVKDLVTAELNHNQFSALVSLVFNIGTGAFRKSTLLHHLNERQYKEAARQFRRWVYDNGRKLNGLVTRREKERALFVETECS